MLTVICCKILLKAKSKYTSFQVVIPLSGHLELKGDYLYLQVITSLVNSTCLTCFLLGMV